MQNTALKLTPLEDVPDYVQPSRKTPEKDAAIIGLTSAVGGAGVTTLAIQMGYHLAQRKSGHTTAIMSLDFETSCLAYYLDTPPKISADHFCQSPYDLEYEDALNWMSSTPFGFDVLALPQSIDANQRVQSDSVIKFLDFVSQSYDYLILDIPRLWNKWTHASLGAADKIAMICPQNIPGLHMTRERSNGLVNATNSLVGIEVILNKFEKRRIGNAIRFSDVEKAFPTIPIHKVRNDRDRMRDALNRGEPLSVTYNDSKSGDDINRILKRWITEMEQNSLDYLPA